ncbi:MAG: pirin family protein [Myxococcota bacterium]
MTTIRRASDRGYADHGWLKSFHTFSFADYVDPRFMGFRNLRVVNEDRVAPGMGFGTHGHRDMEILSYVLDGALQHRDSMGNGSVIRPGDVQRMSAGTGVQHSEFNASRADDVHFLQIWIVPDRRGHAPGYEQKHFSHEEKRGRLRIVASPDGRDGSVTIHQDAVVYAGVFDGDERAEHVVAPGRAAWVHVATGAITLNGERLEAGDAAAVGDRVVLEGGDAAEVLVFDLA